MKFSIKNFLIFTISIILLVDLSLQEKKKKKNFKKLEGRHRDPPAAPEAGKEGAAQAASPEAGKEGGDKAGATAASEPGKDNKSKGNNFDINNYPKILESAPYKVQSCDQVVYVPGKIITDLDDFSTKKDAFFTVSIYFANYFESKDPKTLKESISLGKLTELPQIIPGSKSCIDVYSKEKSFNICLNSKEEAEQIIQAFDAYFKCRIGNNLAPTPENNLGLMSVLKDSCLGLDIKVDPNKFEDQNEANAYYETSLQEAIKNVAKKIGANLKKQHEENKQKEKKKLNLN